MQKFSLYLSPGFVSIQMTIDNVSTQYSGRDIVSVIRSIVDMEHLGAIVDELTPIVHQAHNTQDPHCNCNDCIGDMMFQVVSR